MRGCPCPLYLRVNTEVEHVEHRAGTSQHGRNRRRTGWALCRVSPEETRRRLRRPRRPRASRGRVAQSMGFTAALHAGAPLRTRRLAVSRTALLVSDERRDGRLSRELRADVRAAGSVGRARRPGVASSRWRLPRRRRRSAVPRRERRRTSAPASRHSPGDWPRTSCSSIRCITATRRANPTNT